jgi:hypothetical protein
MSKGYMTLGGAKAVYRALVAHYQSHPEDEQRQDDPEFRRALIRATAERIHAVIEDDPHVVVNWIQGMLLDHPTGAARLRAGDLRMIDWFIGRLIKVHGHRLDPALARDILTAVMGPTP